MIQIVRVIVSVAWFAALSLLVSQPTAEVSTDTPPEPGPCYYLNGIYICP